MDVTMLIQPQLATATGEIRKVLEQMGFALNENISIDCDELSQVEKLVETLYARRSEEFRSAAIDHFHLGKLYRGGHNKAVLLSVRNLNQQTLKELHDLIGPAQPSAKHLGNGLRRIYGTPVFVRLKHGVDDKYYVNGIDMPRDEDEIYLWDEFYRDLGRAKAA